MRKARLFTAMDFTDIKPDQVQRILKDLYVSVQNEQRDPCFGQAVDRRRADRRRRDRAILLDTRSSQSRRQTPGRRSHDENRDNKHKVGIDYYI